MSSACDTPHSILRISDAAPPCAGMRSMKRAVWCRAVWSRGLSLACRQNRQPGLSRLPNERRALRSVAPPKGPFLTSSEQRDWRPAAQKPVTMRHFLPANVSLSRVHFTECPCEYFDLP